MFDPAGPYSQEPGIDNSTITEEISCYRHWHSHSQTYAGGDCLVTALHLGWVIGEAVLLKVYWNTGGRHIRVYYFELIREEAKLVMPVIANPFVERLIDIYTLQVKELKTTFGLEHQSVERVRNTR